MSSNQYDVVVLGAGASGLMLAAKAAARGRKVLVVEKANKVGKKSSCLVVESVISPTFMSNLTILFHIIRILLFQPLVVIPIGILLVWFANMASTMKNVNTDNYLP